MAAAVTAAAAAGLLPRLTRAALLAIAAVMAVKGAMLFPFSSNHFFLELICLLMAGSFDTGDDDERDTMLIGLRWTLVIVLFYTGFQKLTYGTYFHGDFLGYMVSSSDRFADLFQLVIPGDELVRLRALDAGTLGAGPYRVDSLLFVVAANVVYVCEIGFSILLVPHRTRAFAMAGAMVLIVVIELAAREVFFGMLFTQLVLLFARRDWNRRTLLWTALLYLYVVGSRLDLLPGPRLN
jgi:hypothetical protein